MGRPFARAEWPVGLEMPSSMTGTSTGSLKPALLAECGGGSSDARGVNELAAVTASWSHLTL